MSEVTFKAMPYTWALEKCLKLAAAEKDNDHATRLERAFARYIAEHEEAPVDPVILEARKISDDLGWYQANSIGLLHEGMFDNCATMQGLIAALRRGIEIGKGGTNA